MKNVQTKKMRVLFWLSLMIGWITVNAQTVIFEENMGVPAAATLIQNYTGWQNTEVLYIGDGTCDVRTSNASTGYGPASGGGNVMLNDTVKWFQISGISTAGAVAPNLYLGIRKTTAQNGTNLQVQVSADSVTWITMCLADTLPTGTGTSGWHRACYPNLPVASRLHLRFANTVSSDCRIDDILIVDGEEVLLETVSTPVITPSSGLYYEPKEVTIATATPDAVIHFTIDGTPPTTASQTYSAPFTVSTSTTVKAFAVKANCYDSEVATVNIQIQDTNSLVHLPFDISGNSSGAHEEIAMMDGFRGYYLGSSYADGSVKFEASNAGRASLVAHLDSAPAHLSFDLKGKTGGSSPAAYEGILLEVSQSPDGQFWTPMAYFSEMEISISDYNQFTGMTLDPSTRYLRWHLAEAIKGNTQLNNIVITKYEGPADTTAVTDHQLIPMACYPNPTSDLLFLDLDGLQIQSITLTDICGREVLLWNAPVAVPLNLTPIPPGTYILSVWTPQGVTHTKVTKY